MNALVIGYGSIGKRHIQNLLSISDYDIIICTKQKKPKSINKPKTAVAKAVEKTISEPVKALIDPK